MPLACPPQPGLRIATGSTGSGTATSWQGWKAPSWAESLGQAKVEPESGGVEQWDPRCWRDGSGSCQRQQPRKRVCRWGISGDLWEVSSLTASWSDVSRMAAAAGLGLETRRASGRDPRQKIGGSWEKAPWGREAARWWVVEGEVGNVPETVNRGSIGETRRPSKIRLRLERGLR